MSLPLRRLFDIHCFGAPFHKPLVPSPIASTSSTDLSLPATVFQCAKCRKRGNWLLTLAIWLHFCKCTASACWSWSDTVESFMQIFSFMGNSPSAGSWSQSCNFNLYNSNSDKQQSRCCPLPTYLYGPRYSPTQPAPTSPKKSSNVPDMFRPTWWAFRNLPWKPHQLVADAAVVSGEIVKSWTCHLPLATSAQNSFVTSLAIGLGRFALSSQMLDRRTTTQGRTALSVGVIQLRRTIYKRSLTAWIETAASLHFIVGVFQHEKQWIIHQSWILEDREKTFNLTACIFNLMIQLFFHWGRDVSIKARMRWKHENLPKTTMLERKRARKWSVNETFQKWSINETFQNKARAISYFSSTEAELSSLICTNKQLRLCFRVFGANHSPNDD